MHTHENRHAERMRTDPAYRGGALGERERCRQIIDFGLKAGEGSALYRLALGLALDTDMTAEAALKILERMPQAPEPEPGPAKVAVPATDFAAYMAKLNPAAALPAKDPETVDELVEQMRAIEGREVDPALGKEPETLDEVIAQTRALEKRSRS